MICPVCKYDMLVVEYQNIELDYCNSCKGVWFDSGELELLLKSYGLEKPQAFFSGIFDSREAASTEKKRNCPICSHKMKKITVGGQPEIIIDACPDKHGLWFDGGEVTQLIGHLAGDHPPKGSPREQVISFLGEVFGASQ
jgi:Zn-finger nucleic acid-binding protein